VTATYQELCVAPPPGALYERLTIRPNATAPQPRSILNGGRCTGTPVLHRRGGRGDFQELLCAFLHTTLV
jgi:hypothetical protein